MARPSQNLSQQLRIRLTPEEKAQLQRDADIAAVDISTIARSQILNAPIPKRRYRRSLDHDKMADVLLALGKIGTNINQIAKVANSNGDVTHLQQVGELKVVLENIRDEVRAAMMP